MPSLMPHRFVPDSDGDCYRCPLPLDNPVHVEPVMPDTPYAGSSGWSGSDTSHERADDADNDGTTTERQTKTLALLASAGRVGMTWRDLGVAADWHHGQASGTLSVLHKVGRVARLTERRSRCLVYVLPEHVEGRETRPHGRGRLLTPEEESALTVVEDAVEAGEAPPLGMVRVVTETLRRLT